MWEGREKLHDPGTGKEIPLADIRAQAKRWSKVVMLARDIEKGRVTLTLREWHNQTKAVEMARAEVRELLRPKQA